MQMISEIHYLIRLNVMHCGFAMFSHNEAITTNANNFATSIIDKNG